MLLLACASADCCRQRLHVALHGLVVALEQLRRSPPAARAASAAVISACSLRNSSAAASRPFCSRLTRDLPQQIFDMGDVGLRHGASRTPQ